jgi:hypothetical protein
MKHSIPTPEDYAVELLQAIRKDPQGPPAQSSKRVQRLIADIRSSMQQPKKTWNEVGSVLNEETILEPLRFGGFGRELRVVLECAADVQHR